MTKETLLELGLTEEQAGKVMESLNGSFVPKSRFNEVNTELQNARAVIRQRDAQLETLGKSGADAAALQEQIAALQADNTQKDEAHAAEIKKIKVDNAVNKALSDAKAINPDTVKPLLAAFLENAELADDGSVKGLVEEVSNLVQGENTSFLFRGDAAVPAVFGASPAGSVTAKPDSKATAYQSRLEDARKAGNSVLAVAVKREAAADGVELF